MVLAASMGLLPVSEWRLIEYEFLGPRSFSIFHVMFLLYVALLLVDSKQCVEVWRRHLRPLLLIFTPLIMVLLALIVNPPVGVMVRSHSFTMSALITIGTLTGLMLMGWDALCRRLVAYVCGMLSLLMFPILALTTPLIWWWPNFFIDFGYTSFFCYPFRQPNHASFFVLACILLLLGALLSGNPPLSSLRRAYVVGLGVAATVLAVALSGSRTGVGLFVALMVLYTIGYSLWFFFSRVGRWNLKQLISPAVIVAGLLLGGVAVLSNYDVGLGKDGIKRAAWILDYRFADIITGKADAARHALWTGALPFLRGSDFAHGADKPIEGFDAKAIIKVGGNLHSVLINLLVWAGPFVAICFSSFLLVITGLAIRKVYSSWRGALFPLYWACLMVVIEILAYMYIQPVEYFAPIWVSIGVILSLLLLQPENHAPRSHQMEP